MKTTRLSRRPQLAFLDKQSQRHASEIEPRICYFKRVIAIETDWKLSLKTFRFVESKPMTKQIFFFCLDATSVAAIISSSSCLFAFAKKSLPRFGPFFGEQEISST